MKANINLHVCSFALLFIFSLYPSAAFAHGGHDKGGRHDSHGRNHSRHDRSHNKHDRGHGHHNPPTQPPTGPLYGPKIFSSLSKKKTVSFNSSSAGTATLKIINGTGDDIVLTNCRHRRGFNRLKCELSNLEKKVKLSFRVHSGRITLNGVTVVDQHDLNKNIKALQVPVTLVAGQNKLQVKVSGGFLSFIKLSIEGGEPLPNQLPLADFSAAPPDGLIVAFDASASSDPDGNITNYAWDFGDGQTATGVQVTHTYGSFGSFTVSLTVTDNSGAQSAAQKSVSLSDTVAPTLTLTKPTDGQSQTTPFILIEGTSSEILAEANVNGTPLTLNPLRTGFSGSLVTDSSGPVTINIQAKDLSGNVANISRSVTVNLPLPPVTENPVAPTIQANGGIPSFSDQFMFLIEGPNPTQKDADPNVFQEKTLSGLRGRVFNDDGPIGQVKVTIKDHPEYGYTTTRNDGYFDFIFNGGGVLVFQFSRPGYLPVERRVNIPWNQYLVMDDVGLTGFDTAVTTVQTNASMPQVAKANAVTDEDGSRQSVLYFPENTGAHMVLPDGSEVPLASMNVRATEYTVGENGPRKMPAPLSPPTMYTYAVELSVDEAIAAGADTVIFDKPIFNYVDNFLNFPTGTLVPVGYYDKAESAWIPSPNGRVIEILSVTNGMATVAVNSTKNPATPTEIAFLGLTPSELQMLAAEYPVGKTLWRVPIKHFTPQDYNWNGDPPPEPLMPPPVPDPAPPDTPDDTPNECGSFINLGNQVLGESIPVKGTPFSLNYWSDRVPGRTAERTLIIPITGDTISPLTMRLDLDIQILGRTFRQTFEPGKNITATFTWDGKDAYGREVKGAVTAAVIIERYYFPSELFQQVGVDENGDPVFGMVIGAVAGGSNAGRHFVASYSSSYYFTTLRNGDIRSSENIAGWALDIHHSLDPLSGTIYSGDGIASPSSHAEKMIDAFIGQTNSHQEASSGDGGPAKDAILSGLTDVQTAPSGNVYFTEGDRVRKMDTNGVISIVAGGGSTLFFRSSGPALEADIQPISIAIINDDKIYIADQRGYIWFLSHGRINWYMGDPNGTIAERSLIRDTKLIYPTSIRLNKYGQLFVTDFGRHQVLKLADIFDSSPLHIGTYAVVVAGDGSVGIPEDGDMAKMSPLSPINIALNESGDLYIMTSDNGIPGEEPKPTSIVWRMDKGGKLYRVLGGGTDEPSDGAASRDIIAEDCVAISLTLDDRVLVGCGSGVLGQIDQRGSVKALVNAEQAPGDRGDGGPALFALVGYITSVSTRPDGSILVADREHNRVRIVSDFDAGLLPSGERYTVSSDGTELYIFDKIGRHLRTIDSMTKALRYSFEYDGLGNLMAVSDPFNNRTEITRDVAGNVTAITSPYGDVTSLSVGSDGFLASLETPKGERYQMTYENGLLKTFENPRGAESSFSYNDLGQLIEDKNALDGAITLVRNIVNGGQVLTSSSPMGLQSTLSMETEPSGSRVHTYTEPSGAVTKTRYLKDGGLEKLTSSGEAITRSMDGDPRYGVAASYPSKESFKLPNGEGPTTTRYRQAPLADPNDPLSFSQLLEVTTTNGKSYGYQYDVPTRTLTTASAEGRYQYQMFNEKGLMSKVQIAGIEPVNFSYDMRGRLDQINQSVRTTSLSYDGKGYLASAQNPLGQTTSFVRDADGNITSQTLPDGRAVGFNYDEAGNLTSVTPPGRPSHDFQFDLLNQVSAYIPPELGLGPVSTTYSYNLDKKVTSVQRPDGRTLLINYDSETGLKTGESSSGGGVGPDSVAYTYVENGQLGILQTEDNVSTTLRHNGSRLVGYLQYGAVAGSYQSGLNDDLQVEADEAGGIRIDYAYSPDGLLTQAGAESYSYSTQNTELLSSSLGGITDTYSYNTYGELIGYQSGSFYGNAYTRDNLGRIVTQQESLPGSMTSLAYSYDNAGRLSQVNRNGQITEYLFDQNSNRIAKKVNGVVVESGTYDNQDRALSYGEYTYTYNLNGDLTSKTKMATGELTRYEYDVYGQLRKVTLPNGDVIEYLIDGFGRRVGKKRNGVLERSYVYKDQLEPVAELDGSGGLIARYVYGSKSNTPDYMIKNGITYKIISDNIGTVKLVINTATGAIAQKIESDEFGRVLSDSAPGFQMFGFAGGIYDPDTGLVRFGARDYDAYLGRWTSKDPILFGGGDVNLYGYLLKEPLNGSDSNGRGPIVGTVVCTAFGVTVSLLNVIEIYRAYQALKADYDRHVRNIERGDKSECEKEIELANLENQFQLDVHRLIGQFLTPDARVSITTLVMCATALLAPTP